MAIDKQFVPATPIDGLVEMEPEEGLDVEVEAVTTETEDGGMIVDFDPLQGKRQAVKLPLITFPRPRE